ncbi:MAG: type II toxin-antitoxin system RelE/ParE family toxin [Komarekiella atlantica HA4396-MV6]|jgi:mRNA-degrading endonuclease RelE of RelBE toxin-antitoxin system|nr:type II toxin-antitoxin system RelE/ParE family toxin [Komarekiella atlantica HA4396-MV6]
MSEQPFIQVEAAPTFNRNLRILAKKYRSIHNDIQPIITQLERGELPGDQISSIGYAVFKLRVRNTATGIILLTIYTKSEQADIAADDIRNIITEYEQNAVEDEENP